MRKIYKGLASALVFTMLLGSCPAAFAATDITENALETSILYH